MSLINKEVSDFKVNGYYNDEFKEYKKEDILGKWSVFFFYPADFTFVCPTELSDLQDKYEKRAVKFLRFHATPILFTKLGTTAQSLLDS